MGSAFKDSAVESADVSEGERPVLALLTSELSVEAEGEAFLRERRPLPEDAPAFSPAAPLTAELPSEERFASADVSEIGSTSGTEAADGSPWPESGGGQPVTPSDGSPAASPRRVSQGAGLSGVASGMAERRSASPERSEASRESRILSVSALSCSAAETVRRVETAGIGFSVASSASVSADIGSGAALAAASGAASGAVFSKDGFGAPAFGFAPAFVPAAFPVRADEDEADEGEDALEPALAERERFRCLSEGLAARPADEAALSPPVLSGLMLSVMMVY